MSSMTETAYNFLFENETIDWSNKVDITVPSDVKAVFMDFYPGTVSQTGATNPVGVRINGVSTSSYGNARKYHNGSSYQSSATSSDTYMRVFTAISNSGNTGISQFTLFTRNGSNGTDAYPYGQVIYHGVEASAFPLETRLVRYFDTANAVSTINLFTVNSTAVSFRCKVRFSR